jgi:hypothetical protein
MGMKRGLMVPALALAALLASGTSHAAGRPGTCEGILHRDGEGLRIGGGAGEDEGICLIGKADQGRVLAVCAPEHHCRIRGRVSDCKDSGECAEIGGITSVRKR